MGALRAGRGAAGCPRICVICAIASRAAQDWRCLPAGEQGYGWCGIPRWSGGGGEAGQGGHLLLA